MGKSERLLLQPVVETFDCEKSPGGRESHVSQTGRSLSVSFWVDHGADHHVDPEAVTAWLDADVINIQYSIVPPPRGAGAPVTMCLAFTRFDIKIPDLPRQPRALRAFEYEPAHARVAYLFDGREWRDEWPRE